MICSQVVNFKCCYILVTNGTTFAKLLYVIFPVKIEKQKTRLDFLFF